MLLLAASLWASHSAMAASDSINSKVSNAQTLEFKILNSDGQESIGVTRFTISSDSGNEIVEGETRYRDGQHDNERESIKLLNGTPRLESYEHTFFAADGSVVMIDKLDTTARIATCSRRKGSAINVHTSNRDFPADTFAGGSELLLVTTMLRHGNRKSTSTPLPAYRARAFSRLTRPFHPHRNDGPASGRSHPSRLAPRSRRRAQFRDRTVSGQD